MLCKNCGKELTDDVRICEGCGAVQEMTGKRPTKKRKSGKKTLLAIGAVVVALALVLGWFLFYGNEKGVYVRTASRTYNSGGDVRELRTWTYDDRGMMLKSEVDFGQPISVWDPVYMVYNREDGPIDNVIDSYFEYEYDAQGNVEKIKYRNGTDSLEFAYQYNWKYEDNRIHSVVVKDISGNEFASVDVEYLYTYDEKGNLISVSGGTEEMKTQYDMTYDAEGRMTQLMKYSIEGNRIFKFGYDKDGRVEKYEHSVVNAKGVDDGSEAETMVYNDDRLTYTDEGLLLSFGEEYAYQYDGDKLIKIDEPGESYSFSYNGDIPQDQSGKRIYDGNGCLVKLIHEDGSYTEYDYMELTLSEADTLRHQRQQQIYLSPIGSWLALSYYEPLDFTLPVPLDPRLQVPLVTEYAR